MPANEASPDTETGAETGRGAPLRVVLVSPYELGRQPFGLAEPAAWLREQGAGVTCVDLSLERLDARALADADLVAIYVAMHTATRIAIAALPRIRALAPDAHLCAYGLYAPVNEARFRELGVSTVLGGEFEPALAALADRLRDGEDPVQTGPVVSRARVRFRVPDRSTLPALARYAHLVRPGGDTATVGFAEASRGCKHLCRHCPVVPVYEGRFRVVPRDVVLADVRNQVAAGAEHVSFGDPDFLNGPTHALRLVEAMHREFPELTWDATIKVQHIIAHRALLPRLAAAGCLFVTSAFESVDDGILTHLAKNHTAADIGTAVGIMREAGIALSPTFVSFTPWTTLDGYAALLGRLVELGLVESVPPVQLAIRLLVPAGSGLLELPGFEARLDRFDPERLGYPWRHRDPRVDALQREVEAVAEAAEGADDSRRDVFARIWRLAHRARGVEPPELPADLGRPVPRHSEPWYCCAEPTSRQLAAL